MKQFIQAFPGVVRFALWATAILLTVITSCNKDEDAPASGSGVAYAGTMVKSGDDVTSNASGNITATYHPDSRVLNYTVNWQNLSAPPIMMHFHDGVPPSAPIIIDIEGFPGEASGTVTGETTLSPEQATDLAAGKLFAQIHTENWPGGELFAVLNASGGTPPGGGNPGTDPTPPGGGDPY